MLLHDLIILQPLLHCQWILEFKPHCMITEWHVYLSLVMRNPVFRVYNQVRGKHDVQPYKMIRGLKFPI